MVQGLASRSLALADNWRVWSPTLEGSTANPTIGNSTVTAGYVRYGNLVIARYNLKCGSTFTAGTGLWEMDLPVPAASLSDLEQIGNGGISEAGVGYDVLFAVWWDSPVNKMRWAYDGSNSVAATTPITWGTDDEFGFRIIYEAA